MDYRLFLPESWAQDEARCARAKIPEDRREHLTKTELAMEMVRAARARGSRHEWIGGDEVYGGNLTFCAQLEDLGEIFFMDAGAATVVWDADPAPRIPVTPAGTHGRPRRRAQGTEESARKHKVSQLAAAYFDRENRRLALRDTTQGPLQANLWVREVWLWPQGALQSRRRLLVVRREAEGTHKYSLSNAPADTSWERLGRMQAQRFWIEQAFKEAKSELGMAHYEVRGWKGWHHHMALFCLAQLFTARERLAALPDVPMLSARDLVELLDHYLPRRPRDEAEVFRQMIRRHERRTQARISHEGRKGNSSNTT